MLRTSIAIVLTGYVSCAACARSSRASACVDVLAPGDVVISEIFASYAQGASGDPPIEWLELYNATERELALDGATLSAAHSDGSAGKQHVIAALAIAPGGYVTLGNAAPNARPPYLDYGYGNALGSLAASTGGTLALACGDTAIASARFAEVRTGHARELSAADPPARAAADDAWCDASAHSFAPDNYGTPGASSDCIPPASGRCLDDATGVPRALRSPVAGELVISEVMANPKIEPAQEWFEIANVGSEPFDLAGLLLDRATDTRPPDAIDPTRCNRVAATGFAVFAHALDPASNGGLAAVAATFGFSLVNSGGELRVLAGTSVLDAASWGATHDGIALELPASALTSEGNDDAASWCAADTPYGDGANLGTPGAPNSCGGM